MFCFLIYLSPHSRHKIIKKCNIPLFQNCCHPVTYKQICFFFTILQFKVSLSCPLTYKKRNTFLYKITKQTYYIQITKYYEPKSMSPNCMHANIKCFLIIIILIIGCSISIFTITIYSFLLQLLFFINL